MKRSKALGMLVLLALAFCATQTLGVPATKQEIEALISHRHVTAGNGHLFYGPDGSYTYNGADPGRYTVTNGQVCVQFASGDHRCDAIVRAKSGAYYLVNSHGYSFPFKPD